MEPSSLCSRSQSKRSCVIGHGLHHGSRASAETGSLRKESSTCRFISWLGEESTIQEHVTWGSPVPTVFVLVASVFDALGDLHKISYSVPSHKFDSFLRMRRQVSGSIPRTLLWKAFDSLDWLRKSKTSRKSTCFLTFESGAKKRFPSLFMIGFSLPPIAYIPHPW